MDHHPLHSVRNRLKLLLLGATIGLIVAIDPLASRVLDLQVPYLFTAIMFLMASFGSIIFSFEEQISSKRHLLALIFIIIGMQTTSIQIGLDIGEVAIVMLILLFLIDILSTNDRKFLITPLNFMVVIFFMVIIASLAKDFSPLAIRKEIKAFLIFFLMLNLLHWSKLIRPTAYWFIIITTCSAAFALLQETIYFFTGELLVGNIDPASLNRMFEDTSLGPIFRAPALTNGYREFALILCLSISLLVANILYDSSFRKKIWYLALLINLVAISFTLAKDIFLGLILGASIILTIQRPTLLLPVGIIAFISTAVIALLLTTTPGGWSSTAEIVRSLPTAERERMQLNREGIEGLIASKEYLLGAGVYAQGRFTSHALNWRAHNAFILVTDAGGLLALVSYAAIFVWLLYRLACINISARSDEELALARGLLMFYIAAIIALQFTSEYIEMVFWMYAAIVETLAVQTIKGIPGSFSATSADKEYNC